MLKTKEIRNRLIAKDTTLWSNNSGAQIKMRNRLGWLTIANQMLDLSDEIDKFVQKIRSENFKSVVLLGMGGSSLASEVFAKTFGTQKTDLIVIDTTDADQIKNFEDQFKLDRTLFVVGTKSGSTIETISLFRYFYKKLDQNGDHFVAITDPGSNLVKIATKCNFRKIFLNPPDIGGRYSALSYFGLVPAALIGIDLKKLLRRTVKLDLNSAINFGIKIAKNSLNGRDKLTLLTSHEFASIGGWIEQLIAESIGKNGKGIVPINGETVGKKGVYGDDRQFVYVGKKKLKNDFKPIKKHFPFIKLAVDDVYDLGREFLRWEIATAVIAIFLKVNPFNEPNVTESKNATSEILANFPTDRKLPEEIRFAKENSIEIYGDDDLAKQIGIEKNNSVKSCLKAFVKLILPSDYFVISAFTPRNDTPFQTIRTLIRDRFKVATTIGYGPRFLHSTGQLHKGGPNNGVFLQITSDNSATLGKIPKTDYDFPTLKMAQAFGDLRSLRKKDRRIIRVHITGSEIDKSLRQLAGIFENL